ncbi:ABC transporter ATP-binding protein [Aureimonas fodinaquatilis]|uniref:ABC transporter ATP-binding protein n=1 Tax=Aureimonas fodinaquatilis TaxID=2565783 RepID=A0A5B0DVN5_9HYPH|nr:ABC transporter ATP-binding protein [Aureimonas fodinaquatilis]KAA0970408.1 ABC transporter ATP-binding protein [Aureimonas fodinaquatilis]
MRLVSPHQQVGQPILQAKGVTKRFGGFTALDSVDFTVAPGERVGLIGPNGSGKSTCVNCLTGALTPEEGTITFQGQDITKLAAWQRARMGLVRSFQIPRPFNKLSLMENVQVPLRFALAEAPPEGSANRAMEILASIGLDSKADWSPKDLSQVELRKLELGRALAASPRLLIADESMAGLSDSEVDEIVELLERLNADGIAIILIEHIMRAVMRFSQRIVVLVAGKKIADGNPHEVMRHEDVERAYLGQ